MFKRKPLIINSNLNPRQIKRSHLTKQVWAIDRAHEMAQSIGCLLYNHGVSSSETQNPCNKSKHSGWFLSPQYWRADLWSLLASKVSSINEFQVPWKTPCQKIKVEKTSTSGLHTCTHQHLHSSKENKYPGVMVHAFNPSTHKEELGRSLTDQG